MLRNDSLLYLKIIQATSNNRPNPYHMPTHAWYFILKLPINIYKIKAPEHRYKAIHSLNWGSIMGNIIQNRLFICYWKKNILPQKFIDSSEYWQMYLSSAPRIWAPTPVNRGPHCNCSSKLSFLVNAGLSTEYIKQKLCLHSGIETLKYQPSKNFRGVPSKWYLTWQTMIWRENIIVQVYYKSNSVKEK